MGTPFLAEIRIFSFNFPPRGWAFLNGQTLAINQNQAIFSLLGTTFGGNGQTTFQLPNLQGNIPVGQGSTILLGEQIGEATHTLNIEEIPSHTHPVSAVLDGTALGASNPSGALFGNGFSSQAGNPAVNFYSNTAPTLAAAPTGQSVGGQPHENQMPYLTLTYSIALQGIFPSRN